MWFMLDRELTHADGAEQALPALEGLARFTDELRHRLGGNGVDGIDGAVALSARVHATLDGVSRERIEDVRAEIARLRQWLDGALRTVDELKRLKRTLP